MTPHEQAPDGSIIITPKEFYDGVRKDVDSIKSSIARVESAVSPLPSRVDKLEQRVSTVEERANMLDRKIAWFCGAGTALGALAGAVLPRLLG